MGKFYKIILVLLLVYSISTASAQVYTQFTNRTTTAGPYFYLNGGLGYTNFWGDLTSVGARTGLGSKLAFFREPDFGLGINIGYQATPFVGIRFNLTTGSTRSSNQTTSISATFTDYSGQMTISLTNLFMLNTDKLNVYAFGGLGKMSFSKQREDISTIIIPFGLGIAYDLSTKLSLTFETTLHYSGTDDLDQIGSTVYPNFYKMDGVRITTFGLTYKFKNTGTKTRTPRTMRNPYWF